MFSKSFGYALRGILYVALLQNEGRNIHVDEIAEKLSVPRHFMGKILKNLVKHGILHSIKGPHGGFSVQEQTLRTPLMNIVEITDGLSLFNLCVLRLHECNVDNPCPMHKQIEQSKASLKATLLNTTISDLLIGDKDDFIKSITTGVAMQSS
jgi:Rrf2 family transcriptional regulator, iron-sulfur cluster assembly transcription factor